MRHRLAIIAMLTALVAACGSPASEPDDSPEDDAPEFDTAAYAADIETTLVEQLGRTPAEACDPTAYPLTWHCYYDGIEATSEQRVDIILSTPGDITVDEAKEASEQARLHLFNFVGTTYTDLDHVVSFVNGRDTGTTYRRDVPLLN